MPPSVITPPRSEGPDEDLAKKAEREGTSTLTAGGMVAGIASGAVIGVLVDGPWARWSVPRWAPLLARWAARRLAPCRARRHQTAPT